MFHTPSSSETPQGQHIPIWVCSQVISYLAPKLDDAFGTGGDCAEAPVSTPSSGQLWLCSQQEKLTGPSIPSAAHIHGIALGCPAGAGPAPARFPSI